MFRPVADISRSSAAQNQAIAFRISYAPPQLVQHSGLRDLNLAGPVLRSMLRLVMGRAGFVTGFVFRNAGPQQSPCAAPNPAHQL